MFGVRVWDVWYVMIGLGKVVPVEDIYLGMVVIVPYPTRRQF